MDRHPSFAAAVTAHSPPVRDAVAAEAVTQAVRAARRDALQRRDSLGIAAALHEEDEDTLHAEPMGADHGDPSREAVIDAATRLAATRGNEDVALVELHLGGRIYHMLPAEPKRTGICRGKRRLVVYPADPRSFDELFVSGSMFSDHMPIKYTLENLDIDAIERASAAEYVV